MSQYLFLLLVLACPLMMIFMMRGHGHGASHGNGAQSGDAGCGHGGHDREEHVSVDELRRRRAELDRRITEHEWREATSDDRRVEHV